MILRNTGTGSSSLPFIQLRVKDSRVGKVSRVVRHTEAKRLPHANTNIPGQNWWKTKTSALEPLDVVSHQGSWRPPEPFRGFYTLYNETACGKKETEAIDALHPTVPVLGSTFLDLLRSFAAKTTV